MDFLWPLNVKIISVNILYNSLPQKKCTWRCIPLRTGAIFLDPSHFGATYLMMHPGPEGELHKVARNYKQKLALMQLETVCQPTLHKKTTTQC